jgi:SAM-dependent methyltransferase
MPSAAVNWDYSELAATYANRPDYAAAGIDAILTASGLAAGARACDIGAGAGNLTLDLLRRGLIVDAVEPNEKMRAVGEARTRGMERIAWFSATGEDTGRPAGVYDLVSFGSSFNVVDRSLALAETARLLRSQAWFVCLWNHRDLDDPLQAEIEALIRRRIPGYGYGARREDQAPVIRESGLFTEPRYIEAQVRHTVDAASWVAAWNSHATLARHAGDALREIIAEIGALVERRGMASIVVPYVTRIWLARKLV